MSNPMTEPKKIGHNPKKTPEQRENEFLENLAIIDNSKSVFDWLNSCKQSSRDQYLNRWGLWLEYCKSHGLLTGGITARRYEAKKR